MSKKKTSTLPDDDESLVRRFQAGESEVFEKVIQRYRSRLFRFLQRRTSSPDDAEDLTQETLLRALKSFGGLRQGTFLSSWLHQIAYHLWIDFERRRRRTVGYEENRNFSDDPDDLIDGVSSRINPRRSDGTPIIVSTPDEKCEATDEHENLWRVAKQILTADEFRIIWLRYVDEMNDAEIAAVLSKSPVSVRVTLSRARKKLIQKLQQED